MHLKMKNRNALIASNFFFNCRPSLNGRAGESVRTVQQEVQVEERFTKAPRRTQANQIQVY